LPAPAGEQAQFVRFADVGEGSVTLSSPASGASIRGSQVTLAGTAVVPSGVGRVELHWDGMSAPHVITPSNSTTSFEWTGSVSPDPGKRTFVVLVFDAAGNVVSQTRRTITFTLLRPELAGTYTGLVTLGTSATARPLDHQGFVKVTVTTTGGFTGSLLLGASTFPLTGVIGADRSLRFTSKRSAPWEVAKGSITSRVSYGFLSLQIDASGHHLGGNLQSSDHFEHFASIPKANKALFTSASSPVAPLQNVPTGWRNLAAEKGRYTALLQPTYPIVPGGTILPAGDGWATFTLGATGVASLTGRLPDGTTLTGTATVGVDGTWPLFVRLYSARGFLTGAVVFDPTLPTSDARCTTMRWHKPQRPADLYYPAGWPGGILMDFVASKYIPPSLPTASNPTPLNPGTAFGNSVAVGDDLHIELAEGALPQPTKNTATAQAAGIIQVGAAAPGQQAAPSLTAKATTSTGRLSGSFRHPVSGLLVTYEAIAHQKTGVGSGYFRHRNAGTGALSGWIGFSEAP